jgi:hypothetical protein
LNEVDILPSIISSGTARQASTSNASLASNVVPKSFRGAASEVSLSYLADPTCVPQPIATTPQSIAPAADQMQPNDDEALLSALDPKISDKLKQMKCMPAYQRIKSIFSKLENNKLTLVRKEIKISAIVQCFCGTKNTLSYPRNKNGIGGHWKLWNFNRHVTSHLDTASKLLQQMQEKNGMIKNYDFF